MFIIPFPFRVLLLYFFILSFMCLGQSSFCDLTTASRFLTHEIKIRRLSMFSSVSSFSYSSPTPNPTSSLVPGLPFCSKWIACTTKIEIKI